MEQTNIDIGEIVAQIQVPDNLKKIYDATVLAGMRIAFDKQSHDMLLAQLDKPGPLAAKMTEGIISLVFMLVQQSNKTLPPQLILPVAVVLALRVFDFLQKSGEPEATKETLGDALSEIVTGILERQGVKEDQIEDLVASQQAMVEKAAQ